MNPEPPLRTTGSGRLAGAFAAPAAARAVRSSRLRIYLGGVLATMLGLVPVLAVGASGAAAAAGVNITTLEGQMFTGNVVSGLSCPLHDATITWGDGTTSAGTTDGITGIQGTHTYVEEGSYSGSVAYTYTPLHCPSGPQTAPFQATVQDAPLAATGLDSSGAAGRSLTAVVAHLTDANPGAGADDFSAQIAWGDGSTGVGTVAAAAGGGFSVTGTHTYATDGSYQISAGITDVGGSTATARSTARIATPASPPRNLTPPSVKDAARCFVVRGHQACSPIAHTYTCDPGTWEGRDPALSYEFVWNRLTLDKVTGRYVRTEVATAQTFSPPAQAVTSPAGTVFGFGESSLFECIAVASNSVGSTSAASIPRTLSPALIQLKPTQVDIHVTGIEVTQGIQVSSCGGCLGTLPERAGGSPFARQLAHYQGVRMAAGHFTVVRVFASFLQAASLTRLSGATAQLEVFDSSGDRISVLNPDSAPAALSRGDCGLCVSLNDRADPGASFNFLVPWQETEHRELSFRAVVKPPAGLGLRTPVQCPTCKANTFTLLGVPFVPTAIVPVHPIPLTAGTPFPTSKTVTEVFGAAQTVLPVDVRIFPYDAPLAVDQKIPFGRGGYYKLPVSNVVAAAEVAQRASDDQLDGTQYPIGVFIDGTPGLGGFTLLRRPLYGAAPPISIARDDRPLTSAMHEIGHGLGLVHADTGSAVPPPSPPLTGPHPDGTPDCGGNSNGQIGETWPAGPPFDNEGKIEGVGLDRRNWNIFATGSLPRTVVQNHPAGSNYYDFMSYCGGTAGLSTSAFAKQMEADHWISVRNWERLIDFHPPAQAIPAAADRSASAASADRTALRVIATIDSAGKASIFDVAPGQRTAAPPTGASPYRIELRDAAGATLTSVVPATTTIHIDGQPPATLLEATLPFARSSTAVVVSADGRELARHARTAHPPTATLLSPRLRSHIGKARTTLVRWRARDADGDSLVSTVDYSADAGRHWKVVASDISGSSVRVASRLLSGSRNGRLRVRVSDGFDAATAISGRLSVAGRPPLVHITTTGRGGIRADETLLLQGAAFDDAGRPLTGRRLVWYAGRRLLGRGQLLTIHGLPAGATTIRLLADDSRGRVSQAQLRFRVLGLRPAFIVARAPTRVSPKARHVRIVIATTGAAVLTIAGARHHVSRRSRTITIRIRPGRSTLRLAYTLRSPGGSTRGAYLATR